MSASLPPGVSDTDLVAVDRGVHADDAGVIGGSSAAAGGGSGWGGGYTLSSSPSDSTDGRLGSSPPLGFSLLAKTAEVRVDNLCSMILRDDATLPIASSTLEHCAYNTASDPSAHKLYTLDLGVHQLEPLQQLYQALD